MFKFACLVREIHGTQHHLSDDRIIHNVDHALFRRYDIRKEYLLWCYFQLFLLEENTKIGGLLNALKTIRSQIVQSILIYYAHKCNGLMPQSPIKLQVCCTQVLVYIFFMQKNVNLSTGWIVTKTILTFESSYNTKTSEDFWGIIFKNNFGSEFIVLSFQNFFLEISTKTEIEKVDLKSIKVTHV